MLNKGPNYEKEYQKMLRKNDLAVVDLLSSKDKDLLKKIKNFCKKHGFSEKSLFDEIKKNKFLRAVFSKDPGKQQIHEKIASNFIKKLPSVKNFKQLSHGALSILSGGVLPKKDVSRMGARGRAKTIDFRWNTKGKQIYASHKYTKEGGGAQDNQYSDLQEFINEANRSTLSNTFFLAIADGDYYSTRDANANMTRIEYLKNLANRRNVFAIQINELNNWLNKIK